MQAINIKTVLEANEWFVSAEESDITKLLEKQPNLSMLAMEIIESEMAEMDEEAINLFYAFYLTSLKAYYLEYDNNINEVTEDDIQKSFDYQNDFSRRLSEVLDIKEEGEEGENKIQEELEKLESKFQSDDKFDFKAEGLADLEDLINEMNSTNKQEAIRTFVFTDLEEVGVDEYVGGFISQNIQILVSALEYMMEKANPTQNLKIV